MARTATHLTSRRRTIAVAGLQVVLLWIAATVVIWYGYRDDVEDGKRTAENTSLTVAAYMDQALDGADLVVKSIQDWIAEENIASEPHFRKLVQERQFFDAMRDRVVGQPQVAIAGIIARNGELLNNTHGYPAPAVDLSGREAYTASMAAGAPALVLTGPTPGRTSGRMTFYLVRRVTSKSGETLGLVLVGLNVDYLAEFFQRISLGEGGGVSLFRDDGTLLVSSQTKPELLGRRYEDALPRRLMAEGRSGQAFFTDTPSWFDSGMGRPRIVVPRRIEGYPAFVSLVVGEDMFLARWRETSLLVVGLIAALTVVTLLVTRHILRLLDQSAAASRVESERHLLSAIVDTPSAFTAIVDRGGDVVHANTQFHKLFGTHAEIRDVLRDATLRGVDKIRDFIGGDAKLAEVDLEIARPGNQTQMLQFSLSRRSLLDWGECTIMVGHDETVRHQARQAIALSSKMATLGEVTTGIAHELSQPLNVIRMAAQNALTEIEPEETEDEDDTPPPPMPEAEFRRFVAGKLHRVILQVDRAAEILSRMRMFSRETKQGPQLFDIRESCEAVVALAATRLRRAKIVVRQDMGEEPLMVVGIRTGIEQAIFALLLNAADAMQETSEEVRRVEVSACRGDDGHVQIRVADSGPGVPAAIRDRVFEPFFTTKPVGRGTGLGLTTAFGIVRDNEGTLSLVGDGPGATFQIDLPAAPSGHLAMSA